MIHLKNYFTNNITIKLLVLGLLLIGVIAFKSPNGNKQLMTIEIMEYGVRADGIYIFLEGKNIETIDIERGIPGGHYLINHGEALNRTLTKYVQEGWKITATSNISVPHHTRYILEK